MPTASRRPNHSRPLATRWLWLAVWMGLGCGGDETAAAGGSSDASSDGSIVADAVTDDGSTSDTAGADPNGDVPPDFGGDPDAAGGDGSDVAVDGTAEADAADAVDVGVARQLFDLDAIADVESAQCAFENPRTTLDDGRLLDVWEVSYSSWESIDGELVPIRIRGYAARPAGVDEDLPGIVVAHGLGGAARESNATALAAQIGAFALAYTGPGGGTEPDNTSQGRPSGYDNGYRMFDTLVDARGSWFWGHAVAGMRGLTCLQARPEVDRERLGMTGYSAGAVATLMAGGVDDRIVAAVPLSGTGAWDVATESANAWQHSLLTAAGLTIESDEWLRLQAMIDAEVLLAGASAAILMVNGTTDEFFPLTAHMATWDAIPGEDKRISLAGNFDHGCYVVSGVEPAGDIEARAALRAEGGQRMWFGHWFGTDPSYGYLPAAPTVTLTAVGQATQVVATVDDGGSQLDVQAVRIWWSNDDSLVYGNVELEGDSGLYQQLVPFPQQANTVAYVDVEYSDGAVIGEERFSLSSEPIIPDGLVPAIRRMNTCLP